MGRSSRSGRLRGRGRRVEVGRSSRSRRVRGRRGELGRSSRVRGGRGETGRTSSRGEREFLEVEMKNITCEPRGNITVILNYLGDKAIGDPTIVPHFFDMDSVGQLGDDHFSCFSGNFGKRHDNISERLRLWILVGFRG